MSSNRRSFLVQAAASTALFSAPAATASPGCLTDVEGLRVGHFTSNQRPTGCTVVLFDRPATAGVDVRGSAPGTRETDLLNPINTVEQINGILLSGGSAYGLDAATGVMRYLEQQRQGVRVGAAIVPIVPAAVLFDLQVGNGKIRPDAQAGYDACLAASRRMTTGNVGAGTGATIGKLFGSAFAMKAGIGSASVRIAGTDLIVAALVAVNAVGDVVDHRTGQLVAGARDQSGKALRNSMLQIMNGATVQAGIGSHTTLGIVATNSLLTKVAASKIAAMSHDGLARSISPVHTPLDGDTIFAVGTGSAKDKADLTTLGAVAAETISLAVINAVLSARSIPGYPAARDWA